MNDFEPRRKKLNKYCAMKKGTESVLAIVYAETIESAQKQADYFFEPIKLEMTVKTYSTVKRQKKVRY